MGPVGLRMALQRYLELVLLWDCIYGCSFALLYNCIIVHARTCNTG